MNNCMHVENKSTGKCPEYNWDAGRVIIDNHAKRTSKKHSNSVLHMDQQRILIPVIHAPR